MTSISAGLRISKRCVAGGPRGGWRPGKHAARFDGPEALVLMVSGGVLLVAGLLGAEQLELLGAVRGEMRESSAWSRHSPTTGRTGDLMSDRRAIR